jgi:hypothetical protein
MWGARSSALQASRKPQEGITHGQKARNVPQTQYPPNARQKAREREGQLCQVNDKASQEEIGADDDQVP